MLGFAGSSYALFAVVWSLMCAVSGALVTDAMLRGTPPASVLDGEGAAEVSAVEA